MKNGKKMKKKIDPKFFSKFDHFLPTKIRLEIDQQRVKKISNVKTKNFKMSGTQDWLLETKIRPY